MSTDTEVLNAPAESFVLRGQAERVHEVRRTLEAIGGALKARQQEFDAANAGLIAQVTEAKAKLTEEETTLRAMTVACYQATGVKKPGPGVSISETTSVDYELKEAFDWAVANKMALSLDVKGFEQIAKATSLPFVTVSKVPRATIATDLGKALAEAQ